MAKESEGSNAEYLKPEPKRKFSQEQYDFLKQCSKKGDAGIKEWNEWRKKHKKDEVWLEGALLNRAYLKWANLGTLQMTDEETKAKVFGEVHLNGADIDEAHLENADLQFAHLQNAKLRWARLEGAKLMNAHLEDAKLWFAHLEGADVAYAHLQGAESQRATVDGLTSLWECEVNRKTNFLGVSLDVAKIDPATKQLLKYNIRRMNWEDWYKEHWFWRWPVRWFWALSDYGRSTGWIVGWFFGLAVVFALVYWLWPGCLIVRGEVGYIRGFVHALYFSVVTMTTLGFGDIAANPDSWGGQVLLMVQVILGYVLLGALVTRFAVLFTAGGPAGKFAKEKKRRRGGDG